MFVQTFSEVFIRVACIRSTLAHVFKSQLRNSATGERSKETSVGLPSLSVLSPFETHLVQVQTLGKSSYERVGVIWEAAECICKSTCLHSDKHKCIGLLLSWDSRHLLQQLHPLLQLWGEERSVHSLLSGGLGKVKWSRDRAIYYTLVTICWVDASLGPVGFDWKR